MEGSPSSPVRSIKMDEMRSLFDSNSQTNKGEQLGKLLRQSQAGITRSYLNQGSGGRKTVTGTRTLQRWTPGVRDQIGS